MSKISTVEQAHEAICNGEFFQVGNEIINPDDIVRVEYGQEPVFYLEDGSSVQHNRYLKGSVGDLLAQALTVATRGESQSEQLPPELFKPAKYTETLNDYYHATYAVFQRVSEGIMWLYNHDRNESLARIDKYEIDGKDVTTATKINDKDVSGIGTIDEASPGWGHVTPGADFLYVFGEQYNLDQLTMSTAGDLNTISGTGSVSSHPLMHQYNQIDITWKSQTEGYAISGDTLLRFTVGSPYDLLDSFTTEQSLSQVNDFSDGLIGYGEDVLGTPHLILFDGNLVGAEIKNGDLNNAQPYDYTSTIGADNPENLQIDKGGERFWLFDGDSNTYELK